MAESVPANITCEQATALLIDYVTGELDPATTLVLVETFGTLCRLCGLLTYLQGDHPCDTYFALRGYACRPARPPPELPAYAGDPCAAVLPLRERPGMRNL